ncbi:hypothetical protein H0H87_010310 [Tephrocybe sp. NHM501043]|nr:hypothetical protein H0H87_010310 [Tephrocybe sp. NHM501043]
MTVMHYIHPLLSPVAEELTTHGTLDLKKGMEVEDATADFEDFTGNNKYPGPTIKISPTSVDGDSGETNPDALNAGVYMQPLASTSSLVGPSTFTSAMVGPTADFVGVPAGTGATASMDFHIKDF